MNDECNVSMPLDTAVALGLHQPSNGTVQVDLPRVVFLPATSEYEMKQVLIDGDGTVRIDGRWIDGAQAIQLRDFLTAAIEAGYLR